MMRRHGGRGDEGSSFAALLERYRLAGGRSRESLAERARLSAGAIRADERKLSMPTARENMFEPLWQAFRVSTGQSPIAFDVNAPITHAWLDAYRDWGSPLTDVTDIGGGYVVQTFTRAVVSWHRDHGLNVETGAG